MTTKHGKIFKNLLQNIYSEKIENLKVLKYHSENWIEKKIIFIYKSVAIFQEL